MDTLETAAPALPHDDPHRLGEPLELALHILQHTDAPVHGASVHRQAVGLLGQSFQRLLAACGLHAAAVQGVLAAARFLPAGGQFPGQLLQACARVVQILLHLAHTVFLLGNIAQHPLLAVLGALAVGAQHGGVRLAAGALGLGSGQALPGLLGLHVLAVHPLTDPLGRGIEGLQLVLRRLQLRRDLGILQADPLALAVEPVQGGHPGGDLCGLEFVAQLQILFGDLCLLLEGAHLQLQLLDLVAQAQQIFLGLFQLALRFLLAVAEARDARRLLEDFAPVGALGGYDLGDSALADNGIAVPAEAGVHQQGVEILEAHALAVYIIFALPAAVVAAGEHDLVIVEIEDASGVVQDQRDLRVAQGAALFGAAEDDILHLAAAQGLGALLAHDPEDGIGDVRFARAVGPDDGGDVLFKAQARLVREGLEALNFECL